MILFILLFQSVFSSDKFFNEEADHKRTQALNAIGLLAYAKISSIKSESHSLDFYIWPKGTPYKCRTIKELESGPYKGKEAKIMRSLWTMCGIDTIFSTTTNRILSESSRLPALLPFFMDCSPFPDDSKPSSRLFYGKIDDMGHIIPDCWLSYADKQNMFNFHRWELDVLGSQFLKQSNFEASTILPNAQVPVYQVKINNELNSGSDVFIKALFLEAMRYGDGKVLYQLWPHIKNHKDILSIGLKLITNGNVKPSANKLTIDIMTSEIEKLLVNSSEIENV